MSKKKLNIIIFNANYYGLMASSQRIRNLFEPLSENKIISVHNLVINSDCYINEEKLNKNVTYKNLRYSIKNPFSILFFLITSFNFLVVKKQKSKSNILYCYSNPSIENIFILLNARLLGYKIVFDIVEDFSLFLDMDSASKRMKFKIYSLKKMEIFIPLLGCVCFAISKYLVSKYQKYSERGLLIYYLPISTQIDKVLSFKSSVKRNETIKVFYGGTFGSKDGLVFLFDGFELACKEIDNINLILTGKGNSYNIDYIKNRISTSTCKDRIFYLGCLSEEGYFKAMTDSDILCMVRENSEYANAGFPFKLGEYLASGNAVIATKVGEVSDFLENNKNAIIIEPENSNEIRDAILQLTIHSDLRYKIGAEGQKVAKQHFDAYNISEKLYSILIDL